MPGVVDFIRRTPCLVLLVAQLAGVLLYPFMETDVRRSAFSLFGLLVLALTVLALRATPFLTWVAVLLALPAAVLLRGVGVLRRTARCSRGPRPSRWCSTSTPPSSMLAYMLHDERGDHRRAVRHPGGVHAAGLGVRLPVRGGPGPRPAVVSTRAARERGRWMELLFLSFTTLSSTGLSDITPISGHARSVVMLEQVAGVFYIAMVVTRLVALRGQRGAVAAPTGAPGPTSALELAPEPRSVRVARTWVVGELGRDRPRRPGRRRRAGRLRAGHQRDPARRPADRASGSAAPRRTRGSRSHDSSGAPRRRCAT